VSSHGVGEVDACSPHPDQFLARAGNWFRNIADFQHLGSAKASDDDCLHEKSLATVPVRLWTFILLRGGIYFPATESPFARSEGKRGLFIS
jgi:hypothetical protein